jgi:hypothetical protein
VRPAAAPFFGSAFSPVAAAFQGPLLSLGLPALGEGSVFQADALKIVRGVVGEGTPNLGGGGGSSAQSWLATISCMARCRAGRTVPLAQEYRYETSVRRRTSP